ncbi:small conductance mechanosensitive channel [Spirosomataceae bacterium TFI 002]|nr:small conductance mechanosensitive channel [Spirosomataceae bacterium TFI 002]
MQNYIDQAVSMAIQFAPKILLAVLTLLIGFWIIKKITGVASKTLDRRSVDATVKPFFLSLVGIGLKVMLLFSVAGIFGVETASFIAVFGAMAFAIGMALQGSLSHFASGVMLLTFKPYKVGDLVELGGKIGVVEAIQIFNTILLTPDNKRITIPNGVVTSDIITNISGQGEIRVDMTFGIGYSDDIDRAKQVIQEVADKCPLILKSKPVDIFVSELADSSVNFAVRPWANSEHYWDVYFFMHEQLKKGFDNAKIEIPFPQRTVHLQK